MEFLICRTDDEWFEFDNDQVSDVIKPTTFRSHEVFGYGYYCINVEGVEISFSFEDPGIQVIFEGEIEPERAMFIVEEICQNITAMTGQLGRIIQTA